MQQIITVNVIHNSDRNKIHVSFSVGRFRIRKIRRYPFLSPRFPFKLQALLFLGPAFPTPSLMPPLIGAARWGFLYTMCNNAAKLQDGAGMGMVRVLKRVSFLFASSTSFPPGHLLATLCETLFSSTLSTRLLMFLFPFPVLSISTELPLPTVSLLSFVGRTFSK